MGVMTEPSGRRERKKARTRQALADAALELFLERGYDRVSVKDVAEAADVSVTTLFKHFPGKEALVFDLDDELEAGLVAAVRERPAGQSILHALRDHIGHRVRARRAAGGPMPAFARMVDETPALRDYSRRMWQRHETTLARAIAEDTGAPPGDIACAAVARFALAAGDLVALSEDPDRDLDRVFALLENGWQ